MSSELNEKIEMGKRTQTWDRGLLKKKADGYTNVGLTSLNDKKKIKNPGIIRHVDWWRKPDGLGMLWCS